MTEVYVAHVNEKTKAIQTVKVHNENTANLAEKFAIPQLKEVVYATGILHDVGKYQKSFQKKIIENKNIKVEHSTCGAIVAKERFQGALALLIEYCIAGHHTGLPDAGGLNDVDSTLNGRLKREFEDFNAYKEELTVPNPDLKTFIEFLSMDCAGSTTSERISKLVDKFAFLTRYCFSCLTDADSIDTATFCGNMPNRLLQANFVECLRHIDEKFASFTAETTLQKTRAILQQQVFQKKNIDSEIYLMNMPTGSGKTLCSAKFALERAVLKGKKRIIYIIPYNSIIDQSIGVFQEVFQSDVEILRHQSTFSYEDDENQDEDYRHAAKTATENWDAPFIVTTAVQFFESIYANKRGKLRKLHNMADSILIFDEAHLMPQNYLQPCLQAIAYITRYLNSEAVFLTATMPDFKDLMIKYAFKDSKIFDLIDDTSMFSIFQKCRYQYVGETRCDNLLERAAKCPSSLIVVNTKDAARQLYQKCKGQKFHLTTYMTPVDRAAVFKKIRKALDSLAADYHGLYDVPADRRITVISTSLIEAGVDLDLHTVFRELTGLDSILQAGGRCNREGKRLDANVYIFELIKEKKRASSDERCNITKGLLKKYPDISAPQCIKEYYEKMYFINSEVIQGKTMHQICQNIASIPFKTYAEQFELIDTRSVGLVVERDEASQKLIEELRFSGAGSARKLQKYACTIQRWELDNLISQHVVEDYGTGIWCLTNLSYYDKEIGIQFEAVDYYI